MTNTISRKTLSLVWVVFGLAACTTGPQITKTHDVSKTADIPYQNILIVTLFASFDARRKFEKEVVKQLSGLGTRAVASTSLMDFNTPVTRQTFLEMVESQNSDAVMVLKVERLDSNASLRTMNPEVSYKFSPTYYYNVWNVEMVEYVEPPDMEMESSFILTTQIFSVATREAVWAIESKSKIVQVSSRPGYFPSFEREVNAIVGYLSNDGLIAQ